MSNVPPPPPPPSGWLTPPPPPPPPPSPPSSPPAPPSGTPPPPPVYGGPPAYVTSQRPDGLAGFGARLGAYLLDSILYGLLMIPFIVVFALLLAYGLRDCVTDETSGDLSCGGREHVGAIVIAAVVLLVGLVVVFIVYLHGLATSGQTWGRRIVKIKVIDADNGGPPGWGKAIGRTLFAGFVSANIFYLGYLWMLWDDSNQTWHDKVANTLVVRTA